MSTSQANAKMKKFTLRGVLDGLRGSSVSAQSKSDTEIEETLRSDHFHICKTVRHGFPYQPTAVAFDPVQHILAIGNKTGSLRMYPSASDYSDINYANITATEVALLYEKY
ncbi:hypothetical protein BaRGS_00035799 [Batillaria attramentaria]|uniref:Syntaxin-binding protein 5-like n=1 Tax=Batillaria attramentaria TaxID=370345 RepID=A0ABD0JDI6_9CAEN